MCTVNIEFQGFSYLTSSLHPAFIKPKFTLIRSLIDDKSGLMEFLNGTVWTTSGDSVDNIWHQNTQRGPQSSRGENMTSSSLEVFWRQAQGSIPAAHTATKRRPAAGFPCNTIDEF